MRRTTVQVELTHEEWRTFTRIAALRRASTSDILREAMRLAPLVRDDSSPALGLRAPQVIDVRDGTER